MSTRPADHIAIEVLTFLRTIVPDQRKNIELEDALIRDLRIDEDDLTFDLTRWSERTYGVRVTQNAVDGVWTVRHVIEMIQRLVADKAASPGASAHGEK